MYYIINSILMNNTDGITTIFWNDEVDSVNSFDSDESEYSDNQMLDDIDNDFVYYDTEEFFNN